VQHALLIQYQRALFSKGEITGIKCTHYVFFTKKDKEETQWVARRQLGQFTSQNLHQQLVTSIFFPLIQRIKCRLMTKSIAQPLP
jgi:hypothetical protein